MKRRTFVQIIGGTLVAAASNLPLAAKVDEPMGREVSPSEFGYDFEKAHKDYFWNVSTLKFPPCQS